MTREEMVRLFSCVAYELHCTIDISDSDYGNNTHAVLTRPDGMKFTLMYTDFSKRIEVYGNYPRYADGQYAASEYNLPTEQRHLWPKRTITVSPTRSGTSIAKDIEKRFYPVFQIIWESVAIRAKESDAYQASVNDTTQQIAKLFGVEVSDSGKLYLPGRWYLKYVGSTVCSVEIGDLTVDQLAKIKRLLEG